MSAPNFARPLLRAALLLLCLAVALTAHAAPTVLTFSNNGGLGGPIASSGQGGSAPIPGLSIQIGHISDSNGTPSGMIGWQSAAALYDSDNFDGLTDAALVDGYRGMIVRSADGKEFQLTAFRYYNWGETSSAPIIVAGFRNGRQVASTSFEAYKADFSSVQVTLPYFTNVDEVRLYTASGNPSWHTINNLVIDPVPVPEAPDAPQIGAATAGNAQASVSFTAPADNGGATITGYTVTSSPGGLLANGSSSPLVVTGLTNGTSYTFRVTATNSIGTSEPSAASAPAIPKGDQTISFADPGAQAFGSNPTLTASTTSGLAATFTSSTTGVCSITGGGTLTFATTGICTIDAHQAGDSAWNPAPTVSRSFAVNAVAPDAPTIGAPTAGNGQVSLAFTAPASNGGSAITSYTATSAPGGFTASGAGSPLVVTGLDNGTTYTFTVTATNAIGTGAPSASSSAVTPKGTQTITFNNPGSQNFGTSPTLTASSSSGLPVTFTSNTTGVCTITSGGALTFTTAGTCSIDADQSGNGTFAAAPTVARSFTVNAVVPTAPTMGTATAGDGQATVTFSAPASSGGAAITGYTVTANPGGATGTGGGSPITVTGLTNGVSYTFSVTATNSAGTGSGSSASNAIIPASPQTITFANPGAQNYGTTPTLTATSTSNLPVSLTSSTAGVCTISSGTLAFLSAGTCTINANQPGDSAYLAAAQVTQSFTVNAVAPGAPTAVNATPSGTGEIRVAFTAPAGNGGATISGYTVTSSPGGITAFGAASPLTVSGLTVGQSYTFTVTASNSAGTGGPSTASNAAVAADAIVASNSTAAVPYGTPSTITLSISGVATQVTVGSAPTHGNLTLSGITPTYTPTVGYAGPDTFTYTATDGNMTSAPATVSITVGAATLALTPATLASATAGSSYQQTLSSSGGAAPYSYQPVGALPPGISLSASGELSGNPTTAGSYSFDITATDSSTGTGPFSATRSYTVVVAAPQIGFALSSLPQSSTAVAYTQQLQVSGGAAPYAFQVTSGALPSGLSLGSDGTFSGTPTGAGSYAFTVTVTDANNFTASQAFTLQVIEAVQQITAFVANPTAPVYSVDGRFSVSANGGASGSPVVFASTTPDICRVEGNAVVMLAAGRCSLTANQAGNAQYQAAVQATLDVDITAAVPVLQWPQELHKVFGEAAFDLVDPQSPSRGAFSYSSSNTSVASVQGRTVTVVGEGVAVLTVSQAAAGGFAAGTAQLRLVVSQRPDPSRDPGVIANVQAQVDASVRFASAQQANIRDRLRQVRSGSNASSNQLSLSYSGGNDLPSVSVPMSRLGGDALPALPAGWGMWASGSASYGTGAGHSSYDFRTDGLSVGVDRAFGDQFLFGVAGSIGRNNSDMEGSDARVKSDQRSLAAYGLWRGGDHLFVDGVIATGTLDFDTRRWSADADAFAQGTRDGDQWFGSLAVGYEHRNAGMTLTGYGRIEASRSTLDSYRENGAGLYDLVYREQVVRNSAVALGLEGAYLPADPEARVRPFWSIEYRQALDDKGDAYLNYAVGPRAQDYQLRMQSYNDHALSIAAGMDVRLQRGWFMSLLLGHEQTRGSSRASSIGLRVGYGAVGGAAGTGAVGSTDATGRQRCNPRRCPPQASAAPR
ncbi:fibronectin type III domain-containing protein [Stenotrophomonas indicatrix]|uniref:fibronectin type III domain-containing protein n=1 Tax=Stenotrophomonas indicatrix TaxID=2045451 RepID=UPI0008B76F08|nr:autotransporter domain-containing protein [Stenotrophomonas indicatrix]SET40455.1 Fibronectin type III domain-containing protein [Stenotrophomonas indicatrix]